MWVWGVPCSGGAPRESTVKSGLGASVCGVSSALRTSSRGAQFACIFPEMVDKLVLLDSAPFVLDSNVRTGMGWPGETQGRWGQAAAVSRMDPGAPG